MRSRVSASAIAGLGFLRSRPTTSTGTSHLRTTRLPRDRGRGMTGILEMFRLASAPGTSDLLGVACKVNPESTIAPLGKNALDGAALASRGCSSRGKLFRQQLCQFEEEFRQYLARGRRSCRKECLRAKTMTAKAGEEIEENEERSNVGQGELRAGKNVLS